MRVGRRTNKVTNLTKLEMINGIPHATSSTPNDGILSISLCIGSVLDSC